MAAGNCDGCGEPRELFTLPLGKFCACCGSRFALDVLEAKSATRDDRWFALDVLLARFHIEQAKLIEEVAAPPRAQEVACA